MNHRTIIAAIALCTPPGVCLRKSCAGSDADCDPTGGTFCVSGHCYAGLGDCRYPVP